MRLRPSIASVIVAASWTTAFALLQCEAIPDLGERVRSSSLIVFGAITDVQWDAEFLAGLEQRDPASAVDFRAHPPREGQRGGTVTVTIAVQEVLKGSVGDTVQVRAMHTQLKVGCEFPFVEEGRHAIVFAENAANRYELVGQAFGLMYAQKARSRKVSKVREEIRRQRAG